MIKEIALKKRKGAPKHTWSIQEEHQNKIKAETKEEHPKNPKDRRNATLNPEPLASNLARTHTPSIEIDRSILDS
jgi:hypothetical protein